MMSYKSGHVCGNVNAGMYFYIVAKKIHVILHEFYRLQDSLIIKLPNYLIKTPVHFATLPQNFSHNMDYVLFCHRNQIQ